MLSVVIKAVNPFLFTLVAPFEVIVFECGPEYVSALSPLRQARFKVHQRFKIQRKVSLWSRHYILNQLFPRLAVRQEGAFRFSQESKDAGSAVVGGIHWDNEHRVQNKWTQPN
jgi:hypothetical protein